jgi:hypothetical protein
MVLPLLGIIPVVEGQTSPWPIFMIEKSCLFQNLTFCCLLPRSLAIFGQTGEKKALSGYEACWKATLLKVQGE